MRITLSALILLVVVASAAEALSEKTEAAIHKDGSQPNVVGLQAQELRTSQSSEALFSSGEITRGNPEFDMGRLFFSSPFSANNAAGQCVYYQAIYYYTDNTYTTRCGGLMYFCDGLVGSLGACRTPFYTVQSCECIEETQ